MGSTIGDGQCGRNSWCVLPPHLDRDACQPAEHTAPVIRCRFVNYDHPHSPPLTEAEVASLVEQESALVRAGFSPRSTDLMAKVRVEAAFIRGQDVHLDLALLRGEEIEHLVWIQRRLFDPLPVAGIGYTRPEPGVLRLYQISVT